MREPLEMEVLAMARTTPRPPPTHTQTLQTIVRQCPCCGEPMWAAHHNYRTITTLEAIMRLTDLSLTLPGILIALAPSLPPLATGIDSPTGAEP